MKFLLRISCTFCLLLFTVCSFAIESKFDKGTSAKDTSAKETTTKNDFDVLDRIVAVINQEAIPESELNRQTELLLVRMRQSDMTLPPMHVLKKQILDKLILEKLQLQMAKEAKIEVDEETLNQTLQDIAGRDNISLNQMEKFIEEQGIPFKQFRETIKNEMIISKLQQREISQQINISKTDVDNFMKSPIGQDQSGVEYRVGHILISLPETMLMEKIASTEKKAEEIVQQLKKGANFNQTAMAKSEGPQALTGGDLGFRKIDELPTVFSKIVPSLNKGQIYGPIRNESGFHIITLLDKRLPGMDNANMNPEELRNKATETLYQRRFEEKLASWLRRIRDDAEIQTYNLRE